LRFIDCESSGDPDLLAVFGNRAPTSQVPIEPYDFDYCAVVLQREVKMFGGCGPQARNFSVYHEAGQTLFEKFLDKGGEPGNGQGGGRCGHGVSIAFLLAKSNKSEDDRQA
jgi:hypothetical protein